MDTLLPQIFMVVMVSQRAGLYGCPDKTCRNRNIHQNQLLAEVQKTLKSFTDTMLDDYNKLCHSAIQNQQRQLQEKSELLSEKQKETKTLIHNVANHKNGYGRKVVHSCRQCHNCASGEWISQIRQFRPSLFYTKLPPPWALLISVRP